MFSIGELTSRRLVPLRPVFSCRAAARRLAPPRSAPPTRPSYVLVLIRQMKLRLRFLFVNFFEFSEDLIFSI